MTTLTNAVHDVARYLPAWLGRQVDRTRVPGVQVAVRLDGDLVFSKAFGLADVQTGQPLTTDHVFRVASHSKWFTTTVVMRLVEQGLLRLDDRLSEHVAAYADTPLADVTLRSLLGHRAGVIRDGVHSDFWQLDGEFLDAPGLLGVARDHGAVFAPHEFFKYTNIGFSLVGQVVEAVTDTDYGDLMIREICEPLGLKRTMPEFDADARVQFVTGHGRDRGGDAPREVLDHVVTRAMAPATGFCSTAEDLTAFASMHSLGDERVIGDGSRRQMQHPMSTIERPGSTGHYGLGTQIADIDGRRVVGHSGGFPGHITRTWIDPTDRLAVSVLTNAIDGPADPLATGIVKLVGLAAADAPAPDEGTRQEVRADGFTGRYESLWGTVDVVRLGGRLFAVDPDTADPAANLEELTVDGPDRCRVPRTNSYRSAGEPIVFDGAEGGPARSLRITGVRHQRTDTHW